MTCRHPSNLVTLNLVCVLTAIAAFSGCQPPAGDPAAPEDGAQQLDPFLTAPVRVRLMGGNLTSGNGQSYDPGEGIRIFQGTHPDVAMIQEFNYGANTAAAIRGFVDTAFGSNFYYYRASGSTYQIPNGVISRWPILAAGDWLDTPV